MKFRNGGWHMVLIIAVLAVLCTGVYFMLPSILRLVGWAVRIFLPFIIGYFCSLFINPLADKLQKKLKLPRGISAIFVIILTVGIVGGIVTGIVWKIVDEVRSLYSQYPQISKDIIDLWDNLSTKFSNFYVAMPDNVQKMFDDFGTQLSTAVTDFFGNTPVVEKAGNFAKGLPGVFISLIVFLLSLYFMVTDAKTVREFLGRIFPKSFIEKLSNIRYELKKYMGGYVKAQAIIMSIAFVIIFVGLSILGVNYALLIAIGIAVLDALPFFGSGAVLWPWTLISFLNGSIKIGVGLIIIYLAIVLVRQMIEPKIVSSNIGLHPLCTLMAMYVGYKVFSIGGMLLGPITLMLLISFYKAGVFEPIERLVKWLWKIIKLELSRLKNMFADSEK